MSEMEPVQKTLSKNQIKRLKKREQYLEKKQLLKQNKVRTRKPSGIRKKKKFVHISNYKIVLDLEFENLMTDKELFSTIAQIQFCYADNRNREIALDLYCTSMSKNLHIQLGNRCKDYKNWQMHFVDEHFLEHDFQGNVRSVEGLGEVSGAEGALEDVNVLEEVKILDDGLEANVHITALEKDSEEVTKARVSKEKDKDLAAQNDSKEKDKEDPIVTNPVTNIEPKKLKYCYLTADSPNEIQSLSEDTVYIIGAIVDHNRYKNLCLEKAQELGIEHARLPIGSHVKMQARKILTINHVVGILSEYINHHNWEQAFLNVIPQRKGAETLKDTITISDGEKSPVKSDGESE